MTVVGGKQGMLSINTMTVVGGKQGHAPYKYYDSGWGKQGHAPYVYYCTIKYLFVSVKFHEDHKTVITLR